MPHLQVGTLRLPFRGRGHRAQRTSLQGACVAVVRSASQASRMLLRYLSDGPLTDLQLHTVLGLPESRISARRGNLMDRGLVRWADDVMGPFGAENGRYELTEKGRAIAVELQRHAS